MQAIYFSHFVCQCPEGFGGKLCEIGEWPVGECERGTGIPMTKSTQKGKEVCGDRDMAGGRDRKGHPKDQLGNPSPGPSGQGIG